MQKKVINTFSGKRAFASVVWMLFFLSCATYNQRIAKYYSYYGNGEWVKANKALENNRLLQLPRNQLLYFFEKGKLMHSMGEYDSSNYFFNLADNFIEDKRNSVGNIVVGTLLNPMMQQYHGEDFEQFMMHYYKALNYYYLNDPEAALVEARRISLKEYALDDKYKSDKKYQQDAFSLIMQGIIYELNNDMNNAFISYRNAADIYIDNGGEYYNVEMPHQLKEDLLRTAAAMGFMDQVSRYENLLNIEYAPAKYDGAELILFVESGFAPVKIERNLMFTLNTNGAGSFFFADPSGAFHIPFDYGMMSNYSESDFSSLNIKTFRAAFPGYAEQRETVQKLSLKLNDREYILEKIEDINALAFAVLRQRTVKELTQTLSRLATKKLIEELAVQAAKNSDKKGQAEAVGVAMQLFSALSEKADTRNWQSLPHSIYYTRVPLNRNSEKGALMVNGQLYEELPVFNETGLQLYNIMVL